MFAKFKGVLNLAIDWVVQLKPNITPMPPLADLIEIYVFSQNIVMAARSVE